MEMLLKIWVVIISFISIVPLFLIAQNSPKDYLKAHNDERVKVGAKPLKWDPQLASLARKFVKKHIFDCKKGIFDTTFAGNTYGQSNAYNLGSRSGVDAVNAWLLQKINYDYKSNTCIDESSVAIMEALLLHVFITFHGIFRIKAPFFVGRIFRLVRLIKRSSREEGNRHLGFQFTRNCRGLKSTYPYIEIEDKLCNGLEITFGSTKLVELVYK
ncbi:hypothetical protein Ahy_B02g058265 [Arachis hypogaea]|uniref:SCP domain-containing protein n=1 Tax=Arachis hypogaea TaxID=3818 RepID=A0A445AEA3_ARAHY|nr:hypothetical protein Ahy_B02g058265 [Arachis hypogaea]